MILSRIHPLCLALLPLDLFSGLSLIISSPFSMRKNNGSAKCHGGGMVSDSLKRIQ
uniref:Uncharacterized protein n=1 Tax=Setaria viridis TaxID=4556 RepID=A0A4U6WT34_SETVI|nr:hypothetical protein SEVIR_1G382350v2 [Setaria viridis]